MWRIRLSVLALFFLLLACDDGSPNSPKDNDSAVTDTAVPDTATPDEDMATGDDALLEDGNELLVDVDNYIDPTGDVDGDGIPNGVEDTTDNDRDSDGIPNYLDTDSDGDGYLDSEECPSQPCKNSDTDDKPDYLDRDSDNDGLGDYVERGIGCLDPYLKDSDGDGTDDFSETVYGEQYQPGGADPCDAEKNVPANIIFACLPRSTAEEIARRITVTVPEGDAIDVTVAAGTGGDTCEDNAVSEMLIHTAPQSADPANGISGSDDSTFFGAQSGTHLTFDIRLYNDFCYNLQLDEMLYLSFPLTVLGGETVIETYQVVIAIPQQE